MFLSVALTVLGLILYRLKLMFACLCLLSAGNKGMYHPPEVVVLKESHYILAGLELGM